MDEILSIYIIRIKCSDPHIIHVHAQNFYEFHSIHGFCLVCKEKLFKGDMRKSTEEVFTYAAFLFRLVEVKVKIDSKTAA